MTLRLLATRGALLIVVALSFTQPVSAQLAVSSNDNKARTPWRYQHRGCESSSGYGDRYRSGRLAPSRGRRSRGTGRMVGATTERRGRSGRVDRTRRFVNAPGSSGSHAHNLQRRGDRPGSRVVATTGVDHPQAGARASGVSINRAGTLALVANRAAGSVSVFAITGKVVTPVGTVDLCENCQPSLPVFTPDGRRALVTRNGDHLVSILEVNGQRVTYAGVDISANLSPYSLDITPDGRVAVVANIGNGPTGGCRHRRCHRPRDHTATIGRCRYRGCDSRRAGPVARRETGCRNSHEWFEPPARFTLLQ